MLRFVSLCLTPYWSAECLDMDEAIETLFIRDNNGHLNSHTTASGQEAPSSRVLSMRVKSHVNTDI